MAPLLWPGIKLTMVQNKVYALPARRSILTTTAPIEASFMETTGFSPLASGVETALPFVRSTTANNQITIKLTKP